MTSNNRFTSLLHGAGKMFGAVALFASLQFSAHAALKPGVAIESVSPVDPVTGQVQVSGSLDTDMNYTSVDINGYQPSSFDGNSFIISLPPASDYRINLYDALGGHASVDYSAPGTPIDNALQIQVGKQLLADVSPALEKLLANLDLQALLGVDPNKCLLDLAWYAPCDLYLRKMAIQGTPDIKIWFSPEDGKRMTINVTVKIPRAVLETSVRRPILLWSYINTQMVTQDISASFQIGVEATPRQSIRLILDQPSDVQLKIGKISVSSNSISAQLIPLFKNAITGFVNTQLVNLAGPLLSKLEIPGIPLSLPLDADGDGVNDAEFKLNIAAEQLDVLSNGDGLAVLEGAISSATTLPGREVIGSRRVPNTPPATNGVQAPTDLLARVHVDLVNQVLMALYQSGLEQKLSLPMVVQDMGSFGPILEQFLGYAPDQVLVIGFSFISQPEMLVRNDALYPLGLQMFMPAIRMTITVPRGETEELMLDLSASISVATSLGADPDGKLYLDFNNLLKMNVTEIHGGTLTSGFPLPPEILGNLMATAIPQMLADYQPMIAELLNAARIELDIGYMLNDFLKTNQFQSVPISGYITETEVSDDEAYLGIGIGIDFP